MAEVMFYHLTETPLDAALPGLVEKSLARQWRAVVQVADSDQCQHIDTLLWSYAPSSFLPHGRDGDEPAADHPVYVTATTGNPNDGRIRFLIGDAAAPDDLSAYERVAVMFDGNDEQAVHGARERWRAMKAAGHALSYFRQMPDGRWEKAA